MENNRHLIQKRSLSGISNRSYLVANPQLCGVPVHSILLKPAPLGLGTQMGGVASFYIVRHPARHVSRDHRVGIGAASTCFLHLKLIPRRRQLVVREEPLSESWYNRV